MQKLDEAPEDAKPLNSYDYREAFVFCHACGRHNHYEGLTLELHDGSLVLIGNCCARHFFGDEEYKRIKNELTTLEDRAYYQHVIEPYDVVLSEAKSEVQGLIHQCNAIEFAMSSLWTNYRNLMEELQTCAAKQEGKLLVEIETVERFVQNNEVHSRKSHDHKIVGFLSGAEFVAQRKYLDQQVHWLAASIENARGMLNSGLKTDTDASGLVNYVRMIIKPKARDLISDLNQACDFLSPTNLRSIGDWKDEKRIATLKGKGYEQITKSKPWEEKLKEYVPSGFEKLPQNTLKNLLQL